MLKRSFYLILGLSSLVLGFAGIFLPLLPTVPFVLLAAFCFARSHPRLHRWLTQHPWFVQPLADWQQQRAMARPLKRRAMIVTAVSFGISIGLVPLWWLKISLLLMCLVLLGFLWRVPVMPETAGR